MKVIITAKADNPDGPMDMRFGRAAYFIMMDTETDQWSAHDNSQVLNLPQGAGIQAGTAVDKLGAKALVTGNVGPKAFQTLSAARIDMYLASGGTVREVFDKFKNGELSPVKQNNVEGHW